MAWNEPGGGKKDPWNGGSGDPGGDVEAFLNRLKASLNRVFGNSGGGSGASEPVRGPGGFGVGWIILAAFALWLVFDSFTLVEERQRGVVLRFGEFERLMTPGLNLKWPRPVERVLKVETTQIRNISDQQVRMLTRDENIVLIDLNVQYQVSDPALYLFGTRDPDSTLQQATESAVREVVGANSMDVILSGERAQLAAQARERLQSALDQYRTGLIVTEFNLQNARPPEQVKEAFDDAISAREDRQRIENQAEAYASQVVPEARGDAARILAEAEGYREATIARAEGDASRFALLAAEYRKAPAITRQRLYLDTMQEVLADNPKVLLENKNGNNVLYLPIEGREAASGGSTSRRMPEFGERLPGLTSSLPDSGQRSGSTDPRAVDPRARPRQEPRP